MSTSSSFPASGKPASPGPVSEKQNPSSGQIGLPPPPMPPPASGQPATPSRRQLGTVVSPGQEVVASGQPAAPASGLSSTPAPSSRQQVNTAGQQLDTPSCRQQDVSENVQQNLEPIIEILNKSSEADIQIISQDFQCAVCDGKFRSENEIHEHWANHGEAQTSITMMRKIFQLERMVKDSLAENKRNLSYLNHKVNFLQSQVSRGHVALPPTVVQSLPDPQLLYMSPPAPDSLRLAPRSLAPAPPTQKGLVIQPPPRVPRLQPQ